MRTHWAVSHAVRSLFRERQRGVLAIVCVAFGVLSVVSMQLLSSSVSDAMSVPPRASLGGDARISVAGGPFTARDDAALAALVASGTVTGIARIAPTQANLVRREGEPRVYFVMRVFGVEADRYPLIGTIALSAPVDGDPADILGTPGAVIVTRDLAAKLGVHVGDAILLSGQPGAAPARLVVGGIADALPDRRGDTMLYGLATAAHIAGTASGVVGSSLVTLRDPADTLTLRANWQVTTAAQAAASGASIAELFGRMLKGAGLLGLLVGGVGVANTLHVVLARRTQEIAALKTLGYRQTDLLVLFAIETAILGLAGSVVGVMAAISAARWLVSLIGGMESALLLEFRIDPGILTGGVAIGVVTALVFGLHAIVRTSAVRPAVLLRNLPVTLDRRARVWIAALHGVLLATIVGINTVVLGSLGYGIVLTIVSAVLLVALGGALSMLLRLALLTPLRGLTGMARRNLDRQRVRSAFALTALFAGTFAIAMAATVFLNARDELSMRTMDAGGENLWVYASPSDSARVHAALSRHGTPRRYLDVAAIMVADSGVAGDRITLRGVQDPGAVELLDGATWSGRDNEVLLPAHIRRGATTITLIADGRPVTLRVAGRYRGARAGMFSSAPPALVTHATASAIASQGGGAGVWSLAVPLPDLEAVSLATASALPAVTIVSVADYRDFLNRVYRGLFKFVAGVAALALLAGVVLVANSVGLALVERKREMGVLKALGYRRRHILSVIALENGILGAVSGTAGIAAVYLVNAGVNRWQPQAGLSLAPLHAGSLVLLSVVLVCVTAIAVAWRTTGLRPLVVLREE